MEMTIDLPHGDKRVAVTGIAEQNLKAIRDSLGVKMWSRNGALRISGSQPSVRRAASVLQQLVKAADDHRVLTRQDLLETIASTAARPAKPPGPADQAGHATGLEVYLNGRRVQPITRRQHLYVQAIHDHDLTFCTGPAGTGKTYLAVGTGVHMLRQGSVRRLILVRPAVEAGEKLGFLPGNMRDKVNPYLRPLLDALHDMMKFDQIQHFMANDVIEIVPLAFMRGRTLNDALIILDEAQNTTRSQMLMFLTRLGHGGKMIVTGDPSQTDLEDPTQSGLVDAVRRLKRVKGVAMVTLDRSDIVRHSLVQQVVRAYDP